MAVWSLAMRSGSWRRRCFTPCRWLRCAALRCCDGWLVGCVVVGWQGGDTLAAARLRLESLDLADYAPGSEQEAEVHAVPRWSMHPCGWIVCACVCMCVQLRRLVVGPLCSAAGVAPERVSVCACN